MSLRIVRKRPPQGGTLQMAVTAGAGAIAGNVLGLYEYSLPLCILGAIVAALAVSIPWVFFQVQLVPEQEEAR